MRVTHLSKILTANLHGVITLKDNIFNALKSSSSSSSSSSGGGGCGGRSFLNWRKDYLHHYARRRKDSPYLVGTTKLEASIFQPASLKNDDKVNDIT